MRTVKIIFMVVAIWFVFNIYGCSTKEKYWEYKIIYYTGIESRDGSGAFRFQSITPNQEELNSLGEKGWEISTSYLEMETAFPNFGNEGYHTGIKENVRPQRLIIIFKREKNLFPKDSN